MKLPLLSLMRHPFLQCNVVISEITQLPSVKGFFMLLIEPTCVAASHILSVICTRAHGKVCFC